MPQQKILLLHGVCRGLVHRTLVASPPHLHALDPAGLSCGPQGALCGIRAELRATPMALLGSFWVWETQSPLRGEFEFPFYGMFYLQFSDEAFSNRPIESDP